jgi:pre-mRNA-splicing factor ISY1
MARNQEKAMAVLNRLLQAKKDALRGEVQKRPYLATQCTELPEAERWRAQIVREISREVSAIQNGSLGEHKIRDMNDHINKLLREKKHWERQIKILGGPNYDRGPRITDADGKGAMGSEGYFYFGAARELPGVRELFEKKQQVKEKRTRYELYQAVDADYYGYRDDDDGKLEKLEKKAQKKARAKAVAQWAADQKEMVRQRYQALGMEVPPEEDMEPIINRGTKRQKTAAEGAVDSSDDEIQDIDDFKAHVPLPSTADIENLVLEKKKEALLAKYGGQ